MFDREEHLLVFSRYPEPGKTKTRLIPALGAEGAARAQRQMTERTLAAAREVYAQRGTRVAVCYAGGTPELMSAWLGSEVFCQPQQGSDLGDRLQAAFSAAFAAGAARAIAIGIDCPDLDAQLLTIAFEQLRDRELVLGPAEDGGYYLIGLQRLYPELFRGIDWGTAAVFAQTQAIAASLGLEASLLPVLADVDRPEDLHRWPYPDSSKSQ